MTRLFTHRPPQPDDQRQKNKVDRAAAWARIKADAPDLAEFLVDINRTFGKPESVSVEIDGEKIL